MISNSWLCKSVIVKFSIYFLIALTVTDINRCVYGGFSLKERDVLLVQFSYFSNLFRRVLVHFIMYYAVMCNSKGTVQSHVHNVMMFFPLLQFHMPVGNVCHFVDKNTLRRNQVNLSKTLWPC